MIPRTTKALYHEFTSEIRLVKKIVKKLERDLHWEYDPEIEEDLAYNKYLITELEDGFNTFIADPANY
jgi:hypothetical protein